MAGEAAIAPVFAALGDETRLRLVARLGEGRPLSITKLSAGERITRQAVTRHLQVLEEAGLAEHDRQGREMVWQLKVAAIADARRHLEDLSRQWDSALERLRAAVER